jgi:regulator of protease activity HflC (stomatin/prohibitin superfamily)
MDIASVLKGLSGLLWLGLAAMVVLAVMRASRGLKSRGLTIAILVTLVVASIVTVVSAGLVFIRPEDRGVVLSALSPKGYREQPLSPGLRWVVPYFEQVVLYPISRQTYTMSIAAAEGEIQGDDSITARTEDGQEIFLDASVIYALAPTDVVDVHIAWQDRYENELVRPLARGVMRDAVSQYKVEEVVSTKRQELTQTIRGEMERQMAEEGLTLVEFIMRNITFSPEYAASVEQKQIAEQQAKQAALVVEQRRQEAEQARQVAEGVADASVIRAEGSAKARIIEAQAESEALRLIAEVLGQNQELLTYQYITKIAPGIQVMLLPSDNQFLFPLPTLEPGLNAPGVVPTPQPTPLPTPLPTP